MEDLSMHKQTLHKFAQIPTQGLAYMQDKKKQYLIIANSKGISMYNLNKKQFQNSTITTPVSCVIVSDDLIFFAEGMDIGAMGHNGKKVYQLNTYLATQRISKIHVSGWRLWVITGALINQFLMSGSQLSNKNSRKSANNSQKTEDVHSQVFEAEINGSMLCEQELQKSYLILLKNNNQIICYDSKQLSNFKVSSPPQVICSYSNKKYLVGCAGGEIYCIKANKKQIKEVWKITQNSSSKIYGIMQVKNQSFFVFRDQIIEVWGSDQTILARQDSEIQNKVIVSLYLPDKQISFCGSVGGNLFQLGDYANMMKDYKQKNHKNMKQNLQKQVSQLQKQLEGLKLKVQSQTKKTNQVGLKVVDKMSIDYQNLCYSLQLQSEEKIYKIILKGSMSVVKNKKITFSGKQKQNNLYVIQQEDVNNSKILIQKDQKYTEQSKLKILIYAKVNDKLYGISKIIDLKPMIYHHKIGQTILQNYNLLQISGEFKYFDINMWLNTIFIDFGPPGQPINGFYEASYQSILTKQKIQIRYNNSQCTIKAQNPSCLVIIKKMLSQRSRQKHKSLNFSTQLNIKTIHQMLRSLQEVIKPFEKIKQDYELLPSLMQLKNQQHLSEELKQILGNSDNIKANYLSTNQKYDALLEQIKQTYVSYQLLKDYQVTKYELQAFSNQLKQFEAAKIANYILK